MLVMKKEAYNYSEYEQPKRRAKRQVKPHSKAWLGYTFLVVLAVAVALTITGRYAALARTNYETARLQNAIDALEKDNQELSMEISVLKNPARIQAYAEKQLGMSSANTVYYARAQMPAPSRGPEAADAADTGVLTRTVTYLQSIFDIKLAEAKKSAS